MKKTNNLTSVFRSVCLAVGTAVSASAMSGCAITPDGTVVVFPPPIVLGGGSHHHPLPLPHPRRRH
jgi:hypothetical protein